MVSFRRFVLALAVLALFTGLAGAQTIGSGGAGSLAGTLVCTANVANPNQVRAEGHTELLGDIVIACTGGQAPTVGSPIPTANITVTLANTYVTSRVFDSAGRSEALLMIDEPNSTASVTTIPPTTCMGTAGDASVSSRVGAGAGGCSVVVGTATLPTPITLSGSTAPITSTLIPVLATACTSPTAPGCTVTGGPGVTTSPNVFQGIVPAGSNQVIFNGIPILAPVTAGFQRTFRITNIRASAAQLGGGGTFQGTTSILAGVTITGALLLQSPVLTAANVFTGLQTTVRNAANNGGGSSITGSGSLAQCNTNTSITGASVLRFTEGFANAFKTRVVPTAAYSGAGTPLNSTLSVAAGSFTQNTPNTNYSASESGFIYTTPSGVAGLADFGTRLKATFSNIPTGVRIWVSTSNIVNPNGTANTSTSVPANTYSAFTNLPLNNTTSAIAGLVLSETAGFQGVGGGQTGFLPLATATNNVASANIQVVPLTADANGTATAVWEVLNSNPAQSETFEFAVYYTVIGNQLSGTPQITPSGTVALSFAPTVATYNGGTTIPRFAPASTSSTFIQVALCQTTLLFPFVNTTPGFDTGIAIANTSADVAGTGNQTGPCTLNFFGSNAGTTTSAPFPSAGGNIAAGTLNAEQVSNIRNGFQGYVIAVCNFQYAHGFALFSDTGIRNWATSYLALVITGRSTPESLGM